ncbi:galactose-1-phosphate uridylyltransferase [Actinoallomurus sp. NPDC052308]|uniref:galactose-1-phosphate uridylyltransferase n=1 Tax=Actinoallomurus sp. NPDC052308 TaxID=3155530 RepID=UPI003445123D
MSAHAVTASAARTSVRLADGREIIYFDDKPGLDRSAPDRRDLPPYAPAAELRYDVLHGEEILIAAHRQNRTYQPAPGECPLCPSHGDHLSEIPAADYHVVSFENRFPSLGGPAGGRCEVLCFTSEHEGSFATLSPERLATVGRAWADRTADLGARPDVEYVFLFENRGAAIGATLPHPHGQIYAFPYVPPTPRRMLAAAERFRAEQGRCLMCDVVAREAAGPRVVAETDGFLAYVPEAARWPYEVYVAPRACVPDLPALEAARRDELMGLYADVLRRFDALYEHATPYMACWYQAPARVSRDAAHLCARIYTPQRTADKLKFLATAETGGGAYINDVLPETAAARLREM